MAEPAPALLPAAPLPAPPEPVPAAPPLRVAEEPPSATGGPRPAAPRLELPSYDLAAALTLERELSIGHVLSQVLVRRGLTDSTAAREFLDPQEDHPPTAFEGMAQATATLRRQP